MIFGLFKKEQRAETILINAHIYTQNADQPWAEVVACADGKIIYVGNSETAQEYADSDTYVVDLDGKYMVPGLINTHSHPALRILKDTYIPIPEHYDIEDILGLMGDYISSNPDEEVYFAYGSRSDLLLHLTREEASAMLDEICHSKPILILSDSESTLWVNNKALEEAQAGAKEAGLMRITIPAFLQAVAPFDYENLGNRTVELVAEYCQHGFTSIFNAGCPEFADSIYQENLIEMCQQDMIKQRNFGSLRTVENIDPDNAVKRLMQKKTNTTELDDYVHCNTLKLTLTRENQKSEIAGEGDEQPYAENFIPLIKAISERGFDVHIDVKDHKAFTECLEAITAVRNAGLRKNIFVIACEEEIRKGSEEVSLEDMCMDNVYFQKPTEVEADYEYGAISGARGIEEVIDIMTIDAAISLGVSDKLGSIEIGKLADFTVFGENPFDLPGAAAFCKLTADMTIVGGQVVYDAEEDNAQEWYGLISGLQV